MLYRPTAKRHYDGIIVYERWGHRSDPAWFEVRIGAYHDCYAHPERRPPAPPWWRCALGGLSATVDGYVAPTREVVSGPPAAGVVRRR